MVLFLPTVTIAQPCAILTQTPFCFRRQTHMEVHRHPRGQEQPWVRRAAWYVQQNTECFSQPPHLPAPKQALPSCALILLCKPPNYYGRAACSSLG